MPKDWKWNRWWYSSAPRWTPGTPSVKSGLIIDEWGTWHPVEAGFSWGLFLPLGIGSVFALVGAGILAGTAGTLLHDRS